MSFYVADIDQKDVRVGTLLGQREPGIYLQRHSDATEIELPLVAVLDIAYYALTNTDLLPRDDPRFAFLEKVRTLVPIEGWNPGGYRLGTKG